MSSAPIVRKNESILARVRKRIHALGKREKALARESAAEDPDIKSCESKDGCNHHYSEQEPCNLSSFGTPTDEGLSEGV